MARYIQQISLVPFSTTEMWVGWELEGVEGEVDGLVLATDIPDAELARLGVYDFQTIPAAYVADLKSSIKATNSSPDREERGQASRGADVRKRHTDS